MAVVRGVVLSALFAALLAVFSFVRIDLPFTPVSVVLENIVPMLAGLLLGAWYGGFSMLLVLVLTLIGVPMLGGSGGAGVVFGPTGGFVVAFVLAAFLTGWLTERARKMHPALFVAVSLAITILCGALFPYVIGVPWLAAAAHMSLGKAMVAGCYPFLLGDILKAVVAVLVTVGVRAALPGGLSGSQGSVVSLQGDSAAQ